MTGTPAQTTKLGSLKQLGRSLLTALRSRTLIKWVILTELADFMLDKLLEVTGLYFHDVAGVSLPAASAAVTVATVAGLIGNFALVPLLEKVSGVRVLRVSAVVAADRLRGAALDPDRVVEVCAHRRDQPEHGGLVCGPARQVL